MESDDVLYAGYDYPIIRYAEVLLNYAEAVYERDNKIDNTDLDISLKDVAKIPYPSP